MNHFSVLALLSALFPVLSAQAESDPVGVHAERLELSVEGWTPMPWISEIPGTSMPIRGIGETPVHPFPPPDLDLHCHMVTRGRPSPPTEALISRMHAASDLVARVSYAINPERMSVEGYQTGDGKEHLFEQRLAVRNQVNVVGEVFIDLAASEREQSALERSLDAHRPLKVKWETIASIIDIGEVWPNASDVIEVREYSAASRDLTIVSKPQPAAEIGALRGTIVAFSFYPLFEAATHLSLKGQRVSAPNTPDYPVELTGSCPNYEGVLTPFYVVFPDHGAESIWPEPRVSRALKGLHELRQVKEGALNELRLHRQSAVRRLRDTVIPAVTRLLDEEQAHLEFFAQQLEETKSEHSSLAKKFSEKLQKESELALEYQRVLNDLADKRQREERVEWEITQSEDRLATAIAASRQANSKVAEFGESCQAYMGHACSDKEETEWLSERYEAANDATKAAEEVERVYLGLERLYGAWEDLVAGIVVLESSRQEILVSLNTVASEKRSLRIPILKARRHISDMQTTSDLLWEGHRVDRAEVERWKIKS